MQVTYQEAFPVGIRNAAVLTNSYVAGDVIGVDPNYTTVAPELRNQLVLLIDFTLGSLTSADIKIEVGYRADDLYQLLSPSSYSGGVETPQLNTIHLTATQKFAYSFPIKYRYIKVSAIGNGIVTSSSLAISAILGTS